MDYRRNGDIINDSPLTIEPGDVYCRPADLSTLIPRDVSTRLSVPRFPNDSTESTLFPSLSWNSSFAAVFVSRLIVLGFWICRSSIFLPSWLVLGISGCFLSFVSFAKCETLLRKLKMLKVERNFYTLTTKNVLQ